MPPGTTVSHGTSYINGLRHKLKTFCISNMLQNFASPRLIEIKALAPKTAQFRLVSRFAPICQGHRFARFGTHKTTRSETAVSQSATQTGILGEVDRGRDGRSEWIRTTGPCLPKTVLYQAELHSDEQHPISECSRSANIDNKVFRGLVHKYHQVFAGWFQLRVTKALTFPAETLAIRVFGRPSVCPAGTVGEWEEKREQGLRPFMAVADEAALSTCTLSAMELSMGTRSGRSPIRRSGLSVGV